MPYGAMASGTSAAVHPVLTLRGVRRIHRLFRQRQRRTSRPTAVFGQYFDTAH